MIWLELPPFSQSTECASVILGTYHQILAVRGQLAIIVDDQHYELLAGDSLVCMPQHRLALRNVGEDLAELLHIAEKHCMRR